MYKRAEPWGTIVDPATLQVLVERGCRPRHPGAQAVQNGLDFRLWRLLMDCWERTPDRRPTARQLLDKLQQTPLGSMADQSLDDIANFVVQETWVLPTDDFSDRQICKAPAGTKISQMLWAPHFADGAARDVLLKCYDGPYILSGWSEVSKIELAMLRFASDSSVVATSDRSLLLETAPSPKLGPVIGPLS